MSHEKHERFIDAWARAWNTGQVAALDEIYAPDYIRYENGGQTPMALDRLKQNILSARVGFPDLASVVEDIFGERDRLAFRWSTRGTHTGEYRGIAPTGRPVLLEGITLARVRAWRIEEEWVSWDPSQLLLQIGVLRETNAGSMV